MFGLVKKAMQRVQDLKDARRLLKMALQVGVNAEALPEAMCPAFHGGQVNVAGMMICDAFLKLDPTPQEREAVLAARKAFADARQMYEDHIVQDHITEGGLAAMMPDDVMTLIEKPEDGEQP